MSTKINKAHPLTFFAADAIRDVCEVVAQRETVKLQALCQHVGARTDLSPKTIENIVRALDRYGWLTIAGSIKARDVVLTDLGRMGGVGEHPATYGH